MQNILQASGGNKSKTICAMWSEKLHINVRLLLVLRFENGATNRQQNISNAGDTAQQICNVLVLCPIVGLLVMRLTYRVL